MKSKNKPLEWIQFIYLFIIIIIFYFLTRFIFGERKTVEGFSFANSWYNTLMVFYNFWYSIYNFWKGILLFWINVYDNFFSNWYNYINNTTSDITNTGNDISNLTSVFPTTSSNGGSNAPSGIYNTLSLMNNLENIAKYS